MPPQSCAREPPAVHNDDAEHTVVLSPPASAPAAAPHVFISHAGEQKLRLVSHLQARFRKEHPELEVFVDKWSLKGGDRAMQRISEECWGAAVGVLILTPEFVRKKYCMAELQVLLRRWASPQADSGAAQHQGQELAPHPEQKVQLLPVLYDLTVEQLKGMRALYDSEPWCVAGQRPPAEVLDQWAAELEEATKFTMICHDQQQVVHSCAAPPPPVVLVGRQQELEQGVRALQEQRYVEIRGPPGEGKSTLAQHLMESLREKWSQLPQQAGGQAAFMLELDVEALMDNCSQDASRSCIKHALAAKLLASVREETTNGEEWEVLLGWLRRQARVAILFENAERALLSEAYAEDLEWVLSILHALANAHLLVATRVEGPVVKGVTRDAVVQLGQLPEVESLRVVEVHLGEGWVWGADGRDREAARQLVQLVEGNPLVLSVAAGLVQTNKLASWQDVIKRAKETGLAAVRPRVKVAPGGLPKYMTLLSHWLSSFLDEKTRQLLGALTVFPGSFTAAGAEAVAGCSESESEEALEVLVYALLVRKRTMRNISSRHPQQQEERYSMHAVVRDAARPTTAACTSLSCAFVHWMVLHAAGPGQVLLLCKPSGPAPDAVQCLHLLGEDLPNFSAVAAHLTAGAQQYTESALDNMVVNLGRIGGVISEHGHGLAAKLWFQSAVSSVEVLLGTQHACTLLCKSWLATTLWRIGALGEARQLLEEVLEVGTQVLGPEHPDTLTSNSNLASTLRDVGDLGQARQLEEEVLKVRTRVLGPEHPDTLTSKNNLASTLRGMGELGQARHLQREVLKVRTQMLGPEHPDTLISKSNLASTLWDIGERGQARQLEEEVLEVRTRVLGPEHPDTLTSKNNLASTLRGMGELVKARQLQEEVLEGRTRMLGPEHPDTLTSKGNLASTLRGMGKLGHARQLQGEVLELRTQVLGPEHPDTLSNKANLASMLRGMGEQGEARRLEEEVLVAMARVLGPEHPDTLTSKNNLASTLWGMGELGQARQLQEEVLEVRTRVLESEHPDTLTSKNNLASTLWDMGELQQARQLQDEVLEVMLRVLGPEHPDTLTSKNNLASTLWGMGELGQARQLQEEVLEVSARVLGPEHPDTLTSKGNLAGTLRGMGELGQARHLQEDVLEVSKRVLGPEHPDTLTSKGNLAGALWGMGQLAQARHLQEDVLAASTRVLGPEHPDTLTSKGNLAGTLRDMGEVGQARQLQEEVLEARTRLLGQEHPDTMRSKDNLASTLRCMGELGQARQLQEEVLEVRARVLGPEHPDTLTNKNNLATLQWGMGELGQARQLEEDVLEVRARVLGPEHPDTLTSKGNLASTLWRIGELGQARQLQEEVLEVMARVLGLEHPDKQQQPD